MNTLQLDPITGTFGKQALRRAVFFLTFCLAMATMAFAQNTNDDWNDEDDEEEPTEEKALIDATPVKREEVTITLNGEIFKWKEEVHIKRDDTLEISVRDLAPGSRVEIIAEKGGINLSKKYFYANHLGELDLEVHIGNKKIKGKANLIYTPSGAPKKERQVTIIVE